MPVVKPLILLALAASLGLSGCSNKDKSMLNLRSTERGPDEFAILPTKPLVQPGDYNELPSPTPGGSNITDPTPKQDAVKALGGNANYLTATGSSKADIGFINAASRYGVSANIRAALAEDDAEFRSNNKGKFLERLLGVTVYFSAYEPQTLDRYAELERLRRAGVRTPAAPPEETN
ncbi:MAG: hypothetical protein ACI861_000068 [Paracoccaceae bacterium]|jgi:hypothetical protein